MINQRKSGNSAVATAAAAVGQAVPLHRAVRLPEAEPLFRHPLAANPALPEARAALGLTLLDLGKVDDGEFPTIRRIHPRSGLGGAIPQAAHMLAGHFAGDL